MQLEDADEPMVVEYFPAAQLFFFGSEVPCVCVCVFVCVRVCVCVGGILDQVTIFSISTKRRQRVIAFIRFSTRYFQLTIQEILVTRIKLYYPPWLLHFLVNFQ